MTELDERMRALRAVLTETLPFELPFGFTNENLFLSELKVDQLSEIQKKLLRRLRRSSSGYRRPYLYKINRSHRSRNTLGLIHPAVQLRVAEFYSTFEHSIVQACTKSTFSLRYPSEVLRIYSKSSVKDVRKRWAAALPDETPGASIQTPYQSSYFGYRKYLLLDRFFASNELVRLESRFSRLRMLDVSKCFFNIYTHSITWALKEKDYSKRNANKFSFEQQFDLLMQHANYNETAGILVGPEVSRIFAEVILQRIDVDLEHIASKSGLAAGRDYAVRRYVDDFHVFANDVETLDRLEGFISELLENYKLFLNSAKKEDLERPFITSISRVKFDVAQVAANLLNNLTSGLVDDEDSDDVAAGVRRNARVALDALRHIGGSERAALVSSMSEVYRVLGVSVKQLRKLTKGGGAEGKLQDLLARMKLAVRVLFYLLSIDFRVPPIIRASFILKEIVALAEELPDSQGQATLAYLCYELSELLGANYRHDNGALPLELANTFLLGLMVEPEVFSRQAGAKRLLEAILAGRHDCYFAIICGLHALNSSVEIDAVKRAEFIEAIVSRIGSRQFEPEMNCEDYLIFCDFVSCPAIELNTRWNAFCDKLGGEKIGKREFEELVRCLRHTNWKDGGGGFELVRRRLPPVYFSG